MVFWKRRLLVGVVLVCRFALAAEAESKKQIPVWAPFPSSSLPAPSKQSSPPSGSIHTSINADLVYIDGTRYHRFKAGEFAIVVPDIWKLSPSDFDQAFCASRIENDSTRELPITRVEANINSQENINLFAELIQKTIKEKCQGGSTQMVSVQPNLDLGLSFTPRSSQSPIKRYKVFNRGLGPNLFFGADF